MLAAMTTALLLTACGSATGEKQNGEADQLMQAAYQSRNYNQLMLLADSLEQTGSLSLAKAYYWRGYACDKLKQKRMAEFYWKASLEAAENSGDMDVYAKTASRLANLLSVRGDYEGMLKMAVPVANRLEEQQCDTTSDYVNLLIYIGCCQAGLGNAEGADGFERAYQKHLSNIEKNHSDAAYKNAIAGLINIAYYCIFSKKYEDALQWTSRFGELLGEYEQRPGTSADYVDKQLARFNIYQAQALQGLGRQEEAAKVFDTFLTSKFSKTPEGRINANDYLFAANRWDEAADNYQSLDAMLGNQQGAYSIDNIQDMLLKKYQANLLAGRRDSALAVSKLICDSLDVALTAAKELDLKEQTTIVQHVEQINQKKAEDTHRQQLGLFAALALVFVGFIGYIFYRQRAIKELVADHKQLKSAYGELEQRTAEKQRTETEQLIARQIQQSTFNNQHSTPDGVRLFVSSIPSAKVGSSFYDYVNCDGKLFLCIGDTTEKSVESSLMMAKLAAQFRTVCSYETDPEHILGILNHSITEDKAKVSLQIAVLDPSTGQLSCSNSSGTAPLLASQEKSPVVVEKSAEVTKGDILFFYNSGLTKVENAEHKAYGEGRIHGAALHATNTTTSAEAFLDSMKDALQRFTGETPQTEDQIMLAMQS